MVRSPSECLREPRAPERGVERLVTPGDDAAAQGRARVEEATADEPTTNEPNERDISLRAFADKRREYLLRKTGPAAIHDTRHDDEGESGPAYATPE